MFKVRLDTAASSPDPISAIWRFQHVGVTEGFTADHRVPEDAEQIIIDKQLKPGHFGVLEPAFFVFHISGCPHDTVMQWVRHQDLKPQVQSMRYTGKRVMDAVKDGKYDQEKMEKLFWFQPKGSYAAKSGTYLIDQSDHDRYYAHCFRTAVEFARQVNRSTPLEVARRSLASGYRQNFTLAGSLKGFLHALDQRGLADTQWEARKVADMILEELYGVVPGIAGWYEHQRYRKNKLAP